MDVYQELETLIADLRSADQLAAAARIESLIHAGSTGTEILMGVRWILRELADENLGFDADSCARFNDLSSKISNLLE